MPLASSQSIRVGLAAVPMALNVPVLSRVRRVWPAFHVVSEGPKFSRFCRAESFEAAATRKTKWSCSSMDAPGVNVRLKWALLAGTAWLLMLPVKGAIMSFPLTEPSTCHWPARYSMTMDWLAALPSLTLLTEAEWADAPFIRMGIVVVDA